MKTNRPFWRPFGDLFFQLMNRISFWFEPLRSCFDIHECVFGRTTHSWIYGTITRREMPQHVIIHECEGTNARGFVFQEEEGSERARKTEFLDPFQHRQSHPLELPRIGNQYQSPYWYGIALGPTTTIKKSASGERVGCSNSLTFQKEMTELVELVPLPIHHRFP